jgi:hypothetical protein
MSKFNFIQELKGVSSAKGAVKSALNYIASAKKLPSHLSSDVTDKIASAARNLGSSTKVFTNPLIKALRLLNLDSETVKNELEYAIKLEVVKHSAALTEENNDLIEAIIDAGEQKLALYLEGYNVLKADYKLMLKYQGTTDAKFRTQLKKAGIVLPEFKKVVSDEA